MIGQTERDYKGVEAQFMKKKILVLLVCSMLTLPTTVSADILDYEGTVNAYKEDNKIPQTFEIDDVTVHSVHSNTLRDAQNLC